MLFLWSEKNPSEMIRFPLLWNTSGNATANESLWCLSVNVDQCLQLEAELATRCLSRFEAGLAACAVLEFSDTYLTTSATLEISDTYLATLRPARARSTCCFMTWQPQTPARTAGSRLALASHQDWQLSSQSEALLAANNGVACIGAKSPTQTTQFGVISLKHMAVEIETLTTQAFFVLHPRTVLFQTACYLIPKCLVWERELKVLFELTLSTGLSLAS